MCFCVVGLLIGAGLVKKFAIVVAGLVCMVVNAVEALFRDDLSLKCAGRYWD